MARHLEGAPRFFSRAAIAMAAGCVLVALLLFPFLARLFPTAQLVAQAAPHLTPSTEIAALDYAEPSIVWYFRAHVRGFFQGLYPQTVQTYMNTPGPRLVIMKTNAVPRFYPTIPPGWKIFSIRGFDLVKGKWVQLTLLLKPADV